MIISYFVLYLLLLVSVLVAANAACNIVSIIRMWNDPELIDRNFEWIDQFTAARNMLLRSNIVVCLLATIVSIILYLVVTL